MERWELEVIFRDTHPLRVIPAGSTEIGYALSEQSLNKIKLLLVGRSHESSLPQRRARMAKSADAADLKSAARKGVGVQVPLRAPI